MNRDRYFRLRAAVSLAEDSCRHGLAHIYLADPNTDHLEEIEDLLSVAKNVLGDAYQLMLENRERMVSSDVDWVGLAKANEYP